MGRACDARRDAARRLFLDQAVDVSGPSGVHEIELRLTAFDSGPATGGHTVYVDNLRDTPPAPRLTSTRVEPHVIRAGVDTFTMTVTVSDPTVEEVHIDLGRGRAVPAYPASPQDFEGRLVVISDRVLTDTELAYYDTAMREYEKASSPQGLACAAATGGRGAIALPEPGTLPSLVCGGLLLLLLDRRRRNAPRRS